jgi:hypothetical protein
LSVQLDSTRISIRERSYADVLDLALLVIRAYALPLALAFAAGVVPAMLLNAWLLTGLIQPAAEAEFPTAYVWWMLLMVLWETPLVTAPITLYLGQALFRERPRPGKIVRGFVGSLPQMLFYQGLVRGLLMLPVVTWFFLYASWPFLSEVVLLERNPWRRTRRAPMSTYRRAQVLHSGYVADLFVRWLAAMSVGSLMFLSILFSMAFLRNALFELPSWHQWWDFWTWDWLHFVLFYPLALWLVVGYLAVARFLAYLDLRIRREGWEVELLVRAEQARLTRQLT